ncbi:hypothetical protein HDV00_003012 [Rhizophlyctis rosea]|nr:hypothetical protein HDV00_003012 [Rhizophlyctis rosea]
MPLTECYRGKENNGLVANIRRVFQKPNKGNTSLWPQFNPGAFAYFTHPTQKAQKLTPSASGTLQEPTTEPRETMYLELSIYDPTSDVNKQMDMYEQYNLANRYRDGTGVKKDLTKAFRLYKLSAEQGYPDAQLQLARCYLYEWGVDGDRKLAFEWFQKAAAQGNTGGIYGVGFCYEKGLGVNRDESEGFRWVLKAAEKGHGIAQHCVGYYYDEGIGIGKDAKKAVDGIKNPLTRNRCGVNAAWGTVTSVGWV